MSVGVGSLQELCLAEVRSCVTPENAVDLYAGLEPLGVAMKGTLEYLLEFIGREMGKVVEADGGLVGLDVGAMKDLLRS